MPLPNRTWSLGQDQRQTRTPSWDMPRPAETLPTVPSDLHATFKDTPILRMRSWLLGGEVVILAADHARIPEDTPEVVYRASELQLILSMKPEELVALHQTKKALDGDLLGFTGKES